MKKSEAVDYPDRLAKFILYNGLGSSRGRLASTGPVMLSWRAQVLGVLVKPAGKHSIANNDLALAA